MNPPPLGPSPLRNADQVFGPKWQWSLILATVTSLDFELDETGTQAKDASGNPIPTGLLNIQFMDRPGTRDKVPFTLGMAGNSAFMGGLPEVNSACIVAFRQSGAPVILGFLPLGLQNLITKRQTVPNMIPGELLLQASTRDTTATGVVDQFRGAKAFFDRYGRLKVTAERYDMTIGYLLSNENTPEVKFIRDPVTGSPIYFQEKVGTGVERRVDEAGNAIWNYNQDLHTFVEGDENRTLEKSYTVTAKEGIKFTDPRGNKFELDAAGKFTRNAKLVEETIKGSVKQDIGGFYQVSVGTSASLSVVEDFELAVVGDCKFSVGGDWAITVSKGDSSEMVLLGKKTITGVAGITLATVSNASGPLLLGSDLANEPVVLGNVMGSAMTELKDIFTTTPPGIGLGNLGAPVPLNPAIIVKLIAWAVKYVDVPLTSIKSLKVLTERGI